VIKTNTKVKIIAAKRERKTFLPSTSSSSYSAMDSLDDKKK
jgi:hypothetical protein